MDFTLFGVPMIGADICGFISNTNEELCARWIQVGAFYPFSRNHNALGNTPQELYLWDTVAETSRTYLSMRYQLIPYMYTALYELSAFNNNTLATPLWMNFPSETATYTINTQFMMSTSILISPVTDAGVTTVNAYFPQGLWYNMHTYKLDYDMSSGAGVQSINTPLTATNVHLRGGTVLMLQEPAMTTVLSRQNPFTVVVGLCAGGQAYGSLYWDRGEEVVVKDSLYAHYEAKSITSEIGSNYIRTSGMTLTGDTSDYSKLAITRVVLSGKAGQVDNAITVTQFLVDGVSVSVSGIKVTYADHQVILENLSIPVTSGFTIQW